MFLDRCLFFLSLSLYCLSFNSRLLITIWYLPTLLRPFCFGHCIVCPSLIYGFWLPFGIFKLFSVLSVSVIVLSVLWFTASDYPFGIFKLFFVLSVSPIAWSVLQCTASDYPFGIFKLFSALSVLGIALSVLLSMYGFWLSLWYLHTHLRSFCIVYCIVCPLSSKFVFINFNSLHF